MANVVYENFFLSNEAEDQLLTHLNVQSFFAVDNNLVGTPGMKRVINVYRASDGTEKLAMGEGNSKDIEVTYTSKEYEIALAQNRFSYFDEEAMTDPNIVPVGVRHGSTDIYNTIVRDFFAELDKATMTLIGTSDYFGTIVDAVALMGMENPEGVVINAFVNPSDMAKVRKGLKDSLEYVEAYARSGYVGTVAGVRLHSTNAVEAGTMYVATSEAATMFNKTGMEVEQIVAGQRSETAANIRKNQVFTRKHYIVALTDETKAVKVTLA